MTVELTIVIPTLNERDNILPLIRRLDSALDGISFEVIFVDDESSDGTVQELEALARSRADVRVLRRIGRRGLSSACIEGMLASTAPYLAVMDADMQHDETLLPEMLRLLRGDSSDIVIGSRYLEDARLDHWSGSRLMVSRIGGRLARLIVPEDLTDPMSGFFMVKREVLDRVVRRLSGLGFKILLDIFASTPEPLRFTELAYRFGTRVAGESKLGSLVAWEYAMLLADKLCGPWVPVRFIAFSLIGTSGIVVHMLALTVAFRGLSIQFEYSQAIATLVAMTSNFVLNNLLTYRDRRLRGWAMLRGLLTFYLACSIGAVANVGLASYLFHVEFKWVLAALAGILISAVWNYAVTRVYTWQASGPI
jgi:dolichol-phosphate mannosyltransferase